MTSPVTSSALPIVVPREERRTPLSGRCLAIAFVAEGIIMTTGLVAANSSNLTISFVGYGICVLTTILVALTIFETTEMMVYRT